MAETLNLEVPGSVQIGSDIELVMLSVEGRWLSIGIKAPRNLKVRRMEFQAQRTPSASVPMPPLERR